MKQAEALGHAGAMVLGPKVYGKAIEGAGDDRQCRREGASQKRRRSRWRCARSGPGIPARPGFAERLPTVLDHLNAVEQARGTPAEGLAGKIEDATTAKQANRAQYDQLKGPQAAMGTEVDLNPVADAIENSIPLQDTPAGPGQDTADHGPGGDVSTHRLRTRG